MLSNQEILEEAVQKAIKGGWHGGNHFNWSGDWMGEVPKLKVTSPFPSWPRLLFTTGGVDVKTYSYPPVVMLFDHSFAKALWGDEPDVDWLETDAGYPVKFKGYEWKLMQMVIADDPIKYLGENI